LVSIHCFANGNGRHSRLIADLIMEKLYNRKFFSWGSANLVKATEARSNYIFAVKKADKHDIHPLMVFSKS
jgi:fido (protein-threonine AMPylation protein)